MYISLNYFPVLREERGTFVAADPWNNQQPTTWELCGYQMATTTATPEYPPKGNFLSPAHDPMKAVYIGIQASGGERYRILPLALQDLWCDGKLAAADLAWLLNEIEAELSVGDYPPPLQYRIFPVLAITYTVMAVLVAGLLVFLATQFRELGDHPLAMAALLSLILIPAVFAIWRRSYLDARRKKLAEKALALISNRLTSTAAAS